MRSLALVLALAGAAQAAAPRKVAVLELRNPAGLPAQEAQYLAGLVRTEALRLPAARWFVMTRENILEQLPPGTRLEDCVGACEVETGRNVGAEVVVTGEVVRLGGELRVALRLHDTRSGKLLSSAQAGGKAASELEAPVGQAGRALFAALGEPVEAFVVTPLPPVPLAETPPAHVPGAVGAELGEADVDALERYDAAVKRDRSDVPAARKAETWRALARDVPRYRELAAGRAAAWDEYVRQERAAAELRRKRDEARARDWSKLSRLLALEVVPHEDKKRWALAFVEAYGRDPKVNPHATALAVYFEASDGKPRLDAALSGAVGHLVRLRTTGGDVLGVLRGSNGVRLVLEIEGRPTEVWVDGVREVVDLGPAR
jgi:TolB-like protein